MLSSTIVYCGFAIAAAGLVVTVKPIRRLRVATRRRSLGIAGEGVFLAGVGLVVPAADSTTTTARTLLDRFAPPVAVREFHELMVEAPPARVF